MTRFMLMLCGLVGSHCGSALSQQPNLEQTQKSVPTPEIEKYFANRVTLGDYRCAIAVEELREESKNPDSSTLVNFNMIRCRRIGEELVRQDVYEPVGTERGGIIPQSLVFSDKVLYQKMPDNTVRKLDFAKAKEEDWKPLTQCMLYDPLLFPLSDGDSIREYRLTGPPGDQLKERLSLFRELDRKETVDKIVVNYRRSEKYPIISEVRYAPKYNGMPVEVVYYELRGSERRKLGVTNTKWERIADKWVPVEIDSARFVGPVTISRSLHYYWQFGKIDPSIFELEDRKGPSSRQLWDSIVGF